MAVKLNNKSILIVIDSTKGGNGDIWMRLISFYAVAAIMPELTIEIVIPSFLEKLAIHTFGERLYFNQGNKPQLYYTNLGLKDLLLFILKGKKFISPYQRSVIHDKKRRKLKDNINIQLFAVADFLGVVQVPAWKWINGYQGYLDIIGIKRFRCVDYHAYLQQLESDYLVITSKLQDNFPTSPELVVPEDIKDNIVIFPTGTSRQFMPVWWAKQYMPKAYYAFFFKDKEAEVFIKNALRVIFFYKEPGDILKLSHSASWTVTTDSFPSHLLQYASQRCSVTITELSESRIVSPVFKGQTIKALAPCHPCIHLDKINHPVCAAGHIDCLNWQHKQYTKQILNSVFKYD